MKFLVGGGVCGLGNGGFEIKWEVVTGAMDLSDPISEVLISKGVSVNKFCPLGDLEAISIWLVRIGLVRIEPKTNWVAPIIALRAKNLTYNVNAVIVEKAKKKET